MRKMGKKSEREKNSQEIELIDFSYNSATDELFLTLKTDKIIYPYKLSEWIS